MSQLKTRLAKLEQRQLAIERRTGSAWLNVQNFGQAMSFLESQPPVQYLTIDFMTRRGDTAELLPAEKEQILEVAQQRTDLVIIIDYGH